MHSFTTERLLIRPLAEQDKILYLSLYTDAKVMRNIGEPLTAEAAEKGAISTKDFRAKFGRAKNLGDRTIGCQDPGATSMALIFQGFFDGLQK